MVLKLVENSCQKGNVYEPSHNKNKVYNLDKAEQLIQKISKCTVERKT